MGKLNGARQPRLTSREYSAQMDNSAAQYFSGYSASREIQAVIYQASGLDTTVEHTLVS